MIITAVMANLKTFNLNLVHLKKAAQGSDEKTFEILKSGGFENIVFPSEPSSAVFLASLKVFGVNGVSIAGQATKIDNSELIAAS